MRNRYPGVCYRCGKTVAVGDGHFERYNGGWRTQHASCAIEHRAPPPWQTMTPNERTKAVVINETTGLPYLDGSPTDAPKG